MDNFLPGFPHQWFQNTCLRVCCFLQQTLNFEGQTCAHISLLNMFSRYFDILSHGIVQGSFLWERLIICFRAKSTKILTEITYAYPRLNFRVDI